MNRTCVEYPLKAFFHVDLVIYYDYFLDIIIAEKIQKDSFNTLTTQSQVHLILAKLTGNGLLGRKAPVKGAFLS